MTLIILAGIPLYLPAGAIEPLVLGIPYWMALSVFFTLALAAFTSWLCLRRWNLVEQEEEEGVDVTGGAATAPAEDGGPIWKI